VDNEILNLQKRVAQLEAALAETLQQRRRFYRDPSWPVLK